MRRSSESAIALVMTLIMLSIITVMAVAFLALTQRERTAVSQSTQLGDAEIMAEAAAERAKAEIFARYLAANSNLIAADLLVSRNYINPLGFDPGIGNALTNVNYDYRISGGSLSQGDLEQNIANLYYDARVPVFVNTNSPGAPEILDFRFYLDLNRNSRFETNGLLAVLDRFGQPDGTNMMEFVGDPEFVGVLDNPLFPHSRTNRFVGRYAYFVLPIGKSLDVNSIHNHGKSILLPGQDGYFRSQGFGSWELNLAAFLADLNTNVWALPADPYLYNTNLVQESTGRPFRDALEIYNTRITAFQNLAPANQVLSGSIDFANDLIDNYADGLFDNNGLDNDDPARPWPGSYNWTNFYTPGDFFDIFRGAVNFRSRLHGTTFDTSSYDRYTFYRMLAQFSTDSAPELPTVNTNQLRRKIRASQVGEFVAEPAGKININYDNTLFPASEMLVWDRDRFFNTVADSLLSSLGLSVTNIPIFPTNYYGVTVHRMLQMAANIYDATTNNPLPSIFRPLVVTTPTNAYINGYYYDDNGLNLTNFLVGSRGLPMIVGAKKGLPNFNEYVSETAVMAARKLELRRRTTNETPHLTNEMYIVGISNFFGLEAWNSYTNPFVGDMQMLIANNSTITLTNRSSPFPIVFSRTNMPVLSSFNLWPGFRRPSSPAHAQSLASFIVPLRTNSVALANSIFRFAPDRVEDLSRTNYFGPPPPSTVSTGFRIPDWQLTISNDLVYVLMLTNRIVDFVHLSNLTNHIDLTFEFMGGQNSTAGEGDAAQCWLTNRTGGINVPTRGIQMQIDISMGSMGNDDIWRDFAFDVQDKASATRNFTSFVIRDGVNSNLVQQAPFTPTRKFVFTTKWEVNDPLVHHLVEHLKDVTNNFSRVFLKPFLSQVPTNQTLGQINPRYAPWRGSPLKTSRPEDVDHMVKDPGIAKSDDWDFPTNRFASIGWLGRVHRGTPWQTIYLKAQEAPASVWNKFSLDPLSHPTNDWRLLDVFTVAIHPNASHGQLSINQTNFAAWSAVLSGVTALTNVITGGSVTEVYEPWVIEPGSPQLLMIYEAIQRLRDRSPDKAFRRLGDILAVPELTQLSPFIDRTGGGGLLPYPDVGINDTAMERIPQQILSLLKVGDPRYVIYAYGQALRPAENSILMTGPHVGMCTNYQVTGEFVSRTVFQIEGTAGSPRPVVKAYNILSAD